MVVVERLLRLKKAVVVVAVGVVAVEGGRRRDWIRGLGVIAAALALVLAVRLEGHVARGEVVESADLVSRRRRSWAGVEGGGSLRVIPLVGV